jgi:hypothetical protein
MTQRLLVRRLQTLSLVAVLLVLLITACSGKEPVETAQEEYQVQLPAVGVVQEEELEEAATPEEEPEPVVETPVEAYPAAEEQQTAPDANAEAYPAPESTEPAAQAADAYPAPEEAPKPEPKDEIEATAPGTVNLSAGKIQLVEFFAFW